MSTFTVEVQLPEVLRELGYSDEEIRRDVPVLLVLKRFRHGDLSSGNLLAVRAKLSAVIDFGCLGVGDPACDLMVGWTLFSGESRDVFRAAMSVDDATWARARGWALMGVGALPYYRHTNPVIVANARHAIDEVLADHKSGG